MPTLSTGVFRSVVIANETTLGTPGAGPGQLLRRVQSDMNLDVQPLVSPEIITSQQVRDMRMGPRRVRGSHTGVLSPGTYTTFFDNLLRGTWTAGVTKASVTDSVATVDADGNLVLTSATAAWLTAGFKRGDIARVTGASGGGTVINNVNARVVSVTATVLTLAIVAPGITAPTWSSGQTITVSVVGKKLFVPTSGHVKRSFTMEHWFSDIGVAQLFTGNRVQQISLNFPAAGYVQMQTSTLGLNQEESASRTYSTPTAATGSNGLTTVQGRIAYKGASLAYVTGANIQIAANLQADPVVGSVFPADIFQGTISVRGSLTCFMADDDMTADFLAENEVDIALTATTSPAGNADFVSAYMGRVKLMAPAISDGDMGITRTYGFQAIEVLSGASYDASSIVIQDSLA